MMDDIVLDGSVPIVLSDEQSVLLCSWHDTLGKTATHPLLVFGENREIGICLAAITPLIEALEAPTFSDVKRQLEEAEYVICSDVSEISETPICGVCGDVIETGRVIQVYEPIFYEIDPSHGRQFALHFACRDELADTLNGIWDEAGKLLTEYL